MSVNVDLRVSSVQSFHRLGLRGGHDILFSRYHLSVFSASGLCEQFWHGQACPLFDIVHLAFSLLIVALLTLQGALKDDFGELLFLSYRQSYFHVFGIHSVEITDVCLDLSESFCVWCVCLFFLLQMLFHVPIHDGQWWRKE